MKKIKLIIILLILIILNIYGYSYLYGADIRINDIYLLNRKIYKISNIYKDKNKLQLLNKKLNKFEKKYGIDNKNKIYFDISKNILKIKIGGKINKDSELFKINIIDIKKDIYKNFSLYPLNYFTNFNKDKTLKLLKEVEKNKKLNKKYICEDKIYTYGLINNLLKYKININIKLNLNKYLKCYLYDNLDKYLYTYELDTVWHNYREKNIIKGLEIFKRYYEFGELIDMTELNKGINNYVEGPALFGTGDKNELITSKKVLGGGLCGVATIIYQTLAHIPNFKIIKVKNHSSFFTSYYGKIYGFDATVFFSDDWKKAYSNLLIRNEHGTIYLDYFYKKTKGKYGNDFIYGIKIYNLYFPFKDFYNVKLLEKKILNNGKLKCYKIGFFLKNKLIYTRNSCYKKYVGE